ncbi:MAG: hypothetical protein H6672_15965 [Anaerolineaceae bacterium]|nr:hypothetical protein [Anaerolineaceae bacterium]
MDTLNITLSPRRMAFILGGISLGLCLISIAGKALEWELGSHSTYFIYQAVQTFNVNQEANIPTWYSALLLLACAALFGVVAQSRRQYGERDSRHWWGLALIFMYLSLDEVAAIHEELSIPLQESLHLTGFLYFGWILVGAAVVLVVGLIYGRFILRLPRQTRRLFILAGVLYVGGALVIEAISANQWYLNDGTSLLFSATGTVEELCEMLGVVVLIYALLTYIQTQLGNIHLTIQLNTPQD